MKISFAVSCMAITFEPLEVSMRNFISDKCNVYRICTSGMSSPQIVIMWYVIPLLENDGEISKYTAAHKQQDRNGVFCAVRAEI
jgi:hypothetical protein